MRSPAAAATSVASCAGGSCHAGPSPPPEPIATVSSLHPPGGPTAGGTSVLLQGHGLRSYGKLSRCKFGRTAVPMQLDLDTDDGSELRCATPSVTMAGPVQLAFPIGHGGETWAAASLHYRYYDPPQVRELQPPTGGVTGGTLVLVLGAGFGPYAEFAGAALCRFGGHGDGAAPPDLRAPSRFDLVGARGEAMLRTQHPRSLTVPASIAHGSALRCRAPPAVAAGRLRVEVSLNGMDFSSGGASFSYYDNWQRPRVGGFPPSHRGAHAAARLGASLWMFGGTATDQSLEEDEDSGLRNDMHELSTARMTDHEPSYSAPALGWHQVAACFS